MVVVLKENTVLVWGWRIVQLVANFVPTAFNVYFYIVLFALTIPICGRIGNDKNPELIVGMISTLFVILIGSYYVS